MQVRGVSHYRWSTQAEPTSTCTFRPIARLRLVAVCNVVRVIARVGVPFSRAGTRGQAEGTGSELS